MQPTCSPASSCKSQNGARKEEEKNQQLLLLFALFSPPLWLRAFAKLKLVVPLWASPLGLADAVPFTENTVPIASFSFG
jgi:hypothetical protein